MVGARRYNVATRDWDTLTSGDFAEVHVVDQMMSLGLGGRRGYVPASPQVGNDLYLIDSGLTEEQLQRATMAAVTGAFPVGDLIASGSVAIDRVVSSWDRGALSVVTFYRNLEADPEKVLQMNAEV